MSEQIKLLPAGACVLSTRWLLHFQIKLHTNVPGEAAWAPVIYRGELGGVLGSWLGLAQPQ